MTRKIHKIYDGILRIIIFAYLQEFLRFIGKISILKKNWSLFTSNSI